MAPDNASTFGTQHDLIFYSITALTILFTIIVFTLVLTFTIRYRAGSSASRENASNGNLIMEIGWSGLPLLLGLGVFFFSTMLFVHMRTMPKNAREIYVIGKQWMWHMQHGNGVRENNTLHVPVGEPVKLTMISQDVIHAFYVPEFRMQYMVVPGRYTQTWFTPTKVGKYHIFCNMFCGVQHSEMGGTVYVMQPDDFQRWLKNGGNDAAPMSLEERGEKIFKSVGCANCHGETGTERAPSLIGIYGTERHLENGTNPTADDSYLREAILRPQDHIVKGYGPTMPQYQGAISEEDTIALIAYLRRISGKMPAGTTPMDPKMGQDGGSASMVPEKVTAAGAIGAREKFEDNRGQTGKGNLAVGAEAARQNGN